MSAKTFEFFIASRYLRAKRKQAVISVITVISIAGVAAGVMALVIGIAINNGFRATLQRSLLGATAHVDVLSKDQEEGITNWRELDPKFRQLPHVISVAPNLYGGVFLVGPLQSGGAEIKGIPVDNPPDMLKHLKQGSFEKLKDTSGLPGIILGSGLAQKTGMLLGSVVNVFSPRAEMTPLNPMHFPAPFKFRVVGIFESGFYDLDSAFAFTSLSSAQVIFNVGDVVNSIELQLDDIYKAPDVAKLADTIASPKLNATTWMEQYHPILDALGMERLVTAVTIGLIEIVAASEHSDHADHDGDGEKPRDRRAHVDGCDAPPNPQNLYAARRADRRRRNRHRSRARLHAVDPGRSLPLAALERGCLLAGLRSLQPALAGRHLDRRRRDSCQLDRDPLSRPRRHRHRARGSFAL